MITCAACGFETSDDFAFCPKCATALTASLAVPEERKVVTTLFCDLVAFTAMSEAADPEDVDRLLNEYSLLARSAIESHGGTVDETRSGGQRPDGALSGTLCDKDLGSAETPPAPWSRRRDREER